MAEQCGLALFYVPSARNGPNEPGQVPEDKGNAILSTLPLADLAAIELPFESGRKVAVVATIPGPSGERIRVASVHLDLASTLTRTFPDSPPWDGRPTRGPFPPDHILYRTVLGSRTVLVQGSYRRFEKTYGSDHAARIVWLRGQDTGPLGHADDTVTVRSPGPRVP